MMGLVDTGPDHPCDRCGHPLKYHASPAEWSVCRIVEGKVFRGPITKMPRAYRCWCDGYVRS